MTFVSKHQIDLNHPQNQDIMPGLLDLPTELIEQIFDKCGDIAYNEWRTENPKASHFWRQVAVPPFRSSCRYVERATRHSFAKNYLRMGHYYIAANDASIESLCAQVKVEEFAATKDFIYFELDDDKNAKFSPLHEVSGQHESAESSGKATTHVLEDATGASVPLAVYRNRKVLVEALRACTNLADLHFTGNLPHQDPPAAQLFEDEDEKIMFDVNSSVAYVLSLAEAAGVRLEKIFISTSFGNTRVGLTDCTSLIRHKSIFQSMKHLDLVLNEDESATHEEV